MPVGEGGRWVLGPGHYWRAGPQQRGTRGLRGLVGCHVFVRGVDGPLQDVAVVACLVVLDHPSEIPQRRRVPSKQARDVAAVPGPFLGSSPVTTRRRDQREQVDTGLPAQRFAGVVA